MPAFLETLLTPESAACFSSAGYLPPSRNGRVFGGALLAQLLMAAAGTSHGDGRPHSIRAHFLRPGEASVRVDYSAEVLRSSRRFTTTRVDAAQDGATLATATVSFHSAESSAEHTERGPWLLGGPTGAPLASGGPVPSPEAPIRAPFDFRAAPEVGRTSSDDRPVVGYWLSVRQPLAHRPGLHAAALAWASDFSLTRVADLEYEHQSGRRQAASLDHAMWFHRDVDLNGWMYYELTSPVYRDALALSTGKFFDEQGNLVATVPRRACCGAGETGVLRRVSRIEVRQSRPRSRTETR